MGGDEIVFLELDGNQDVCGRRQCEEQVRHRHLRRRPEYEQPADIQRMAHLSIQPRHAELNRLIRSTDKLQPGLPQPEQIEM